MNPREKKITRPIFLTFQNKDELNYLTPRPFFKNFRHHLFDNRSRLCISLEL